MTYPVARMQLVLVVFLISSGVSSGGASADKRKGPIQIGVLTAYGPDNYETGRQAARLVDKILKGANPADIPVETNSKIEFVINLETAQALGLAIAPEVLFQANKIVRQAR